MPILWYVINCWFIWNLYVLKGFVLIKNWGIYEIEELKIEEREREREREREDWKKKDESEEKNKRIYK